MSINNVCVLYLCTYWL